MVLLVGGSVLNNDDGRKLQDGAFKTLEEQPVPGLRQKGPG